MYSVSFLHLHLLGMNRPELCHLSCCVAVQLSGRCQAMGMSSNYFDMELASTSNVTAQLPSAQRLAPFSLSHPRAQHF